MTKYTTRELLENLLNFVITKDLVIQTLSTDPDFLTEPSYSEGPPSSSQQQGWANAGLDIPLNVATQRITDALHRMESVVAHADQYNLHIQPRTPYSLAIELVLQVNLESSFDITEFGRPAFAKAIEAALAEAAFGFDADQLTQTEREQARKYANALFDSAANIRAQVTAAYMGITRSQDDQYRNLAWRAPIASEHGTAADLSAILGHQNYVNVPEFSSVHSPAAYLADLEKCRLQYVSTKEVDAEGSYDPFGKSFDFETRRADILSLELNEQNTTVLVPKLDIAIDVLETQIAAQRGVDKKDVSDAIAQEYYPLDLPFNLKLAKCDALAGILSTSMREIWQALAPDLAHISSADDQRYAVVRDKLGLTQPELFGLYVPAITDVNAWRYGFQDEDFETINQVEVFKDATGLNSAEIDALLFPFVEHPTEDDLAASPGISVLSRTYLNAFDAVNGDGDSSQGVHYPPLHISPADPQKFAHFTPERQARANKVIRLSKKLGLSFEDIYRMLSYTAKVRQLAIDVDVLSHQYLPTTLSLLAGLLDVQKVLSRNASSLVSISETIATVGVLNDSPERDGVSQVEAVFGTDLSLGMDWPKASEDPAEHQRIAGLIRTALGLNQTEYDAIEAKIEAHLITPTPRSLAALERRPGHGYSGELRDRAGHLPYGYRTYDPAGSRWLSPDPLGRRGSARLSLNAYQMVNRNPVSQRDVFGLVEYDPNFLMGGMMREDGALFDLVIQTLVSLMVNKHAMRVPREVQSLIQKYSPHDSAPYHPKYFALGGNAPRLSRYSDLGNGDDAGRLARVFIRDHIENGFQTHETLHSTKDFMGPMINLLASQVMFDHQQWKANAERVPNHLARIRRFTLLRGLFGTLAIPDHHGDLYEENSFLGSLKTLKLSQLDLSGLNASFKFVTSSKKTIWRDLKSAYFAERAFFRRGLTRQLYDLGFTNVDGAFELSESILSQEDYRFENIASRSRQEKQGRWFKHLDFGWEEIERQKKRLKQRQKLASLKSRRGLQTHGKKKVRFFRVYKQKHLSKDQIKKIKRHHRELHERQLNASKSIDRRALPPQEIPYAQFYNTWSDYRSTTPSSVGISKPSKSKPPELNVHLAKNRSRYTFAYPILHSGLREKDRQYIFNHMQRDIWVSLQFGATGRHKNVNTGRHHEHLFTGKGVFSFAYILTGTYDRLNKRPYARAVIYNYAKGKQKNQSKTHYEWVYQPDFKTPGPRQGGPPKLPFDLKAIMIGATSQAPKSQKSGSQKTKNQRPKSRKKR